MNSVLTNDTTNLLMPMSATADYFQSYAIKATEKEAQKNKEDGEKFLENNKKDSNVKVTASGLQYKVVTEGKGVKPNPTDKVKVHYRGTLLDGTVFDSSYERGQPIEFELNKVIKGWTEGLQLMTVGSKYILYIPYDLAYGTRGNGSIKPYSTLIFEVELLDVAKPVVNTIQGAKFQFPEYQRTIK
jgi:FKBP-type peptidyl-prolyl cis-trans isomerase